MGFLQPSTGGGGGGGAVTVADGADVAEGASTAASYAGGGGATSAIALLRAIWDKVAGTLTATISGALPTGGNTIGNVGIISSTVHTGATTDSINAYTDMLQVLYNGTLYNIAYADIATSGSGQTAIVAATASRKCLVLGWDLVANGTVNAKWQSASTDLAGLYYLVANTGIARDGGNHGLFITATNTVLNLNLSGAVAVGGSIQYALVA